MIQYSGRAFERCIGDYLLFVYFSRTKPMKMTVTHIRARCSNLLSALRALDEKLK